ncbi:hypothetical protein NDI37_25485 [Funiculus sociatus GB2-A5]|uniref:Uncharacterized protein n=1 Tax=Funiculus sociatus GB2-A5 TaxID=2933946 RepID=A0ABV0JYV8_9CYAN|nr:hypothetical protein [Trichocoleus sp. FACHB-6]MBD2060676.1 hypothetical protein [Trichocoleus sp. FACHB-6]
MLFQSDIQNLESEIASLQAVIAARQSRIDQLNQAESVAGSAIQTLQDAVVKVSELAPDAIALLKSAVLGLFSDDGEGGDEPSPEPEPTPDHDGNDNPGSFDDFGSDDDSPADNTEDDIPTGDNDGSDIPAGSLVQIENPATGEKISWVTPASAPTEIDQPSQAYIHKVKERFRSTLGYKHISAAALTPHFVKAALRNRTEEFMSAVNLERTGKQFWIAVDSWLQDFEAHRAVQPGFTYQETPESSPLTPEFLVYEGSICIGKIRESLTLGGWIHKHRSLQHPFKCREDAAADLLARYQRQQETLHKSHNEILTAHGF